MFKNIRVHSHDNIAFFGRLSITFEGSCRLVLRKRQENLERKTFLEMETVLYYRTLYVNLERTTLKDYSITMDENTRKYRSLVVIPRRWGLLPTLDLYVLQEFLIKLSVLLLVFIILFVLGDVFNELGDFLDEDAPMRDFFTFLLLRLPGNIRFVLPISMLLGCMWTMATFGKNLEVTAMRASGVSLFRCGGPILAMGLLVTGINIYFNEALVPYTEREAMVVRNTAVEKGEDLKMLTYRSPDRSYNWFFRSFSSGTENSGVTLKKMRPDGSLEWDISAARVLFNEQRGWTFERVVRTPYSRDGLMPKQSEHLPSLTLSRKELPETPDDIFNAIKDEEELPTWVIWSLVARNPDMSDRVRAIYMTVFYYRLAFPWACFLAVFLGIPLATKNERSGSLMAIIMAVVIIVAYIVIAQVFLVLGKGGILPAPIAGLAPTIAFIAYGYCKVFFSRA